MRPTIPLILALTLQSCIITRPPDELRFRIIHYSCPVDVNGKRVTLCFCAANITKGYNAQFVSFMQGPHRYAFSYHVQVRFRHPVKDGQRVTEFVITGWKGRDLLRTV